MLGTTAADQAKRADLRVVQLAYLNDWEDQPVCRAEGESASWQQIRFR
jgi:hypothetical protein